MALNGCKSIAITSAIWWVFPLFVCVSQTVNFLLVILKLLVSDQCHFVLLLFFSNHYTFPPWINAEILYDLFVVLNFLDYWLLCITFSLQLKQIVFVFLPLSLTKTSRYLILFSIHKTQFFWTTIITSLSLSSYSSACMFITFSCHHSLMSLSIRTSIKLQNWIQYQC